jgi:hypothetical protein
MLLADGTELGPREILAGTLIQGMKEVTHASSNL